MPNRNDPEYQRAVDAFVRREVGHCVSSLVSTLANGAYVDFTHSKDAYAKDLREVFEQASELCAPLPDFEEAARSSTLIEYDDKSAAEGEWPWYVCEAPDEDDEHDSRAVQRDGSWRIYFETAEEACAENGIDPYEREIFEHWIVSDWLADKLAEKGERIDKDFAGLTVWGRTTTGQGIASDSVIQDIYEERKRAACVLLGLEAS